MRHGRRGLAAALTVFALVAAACGSDDTTSSSGGDTSVGTETTVAGTDTTVGSTETTAATTGEGDVRELVIARDMDINSLDPSRVYCDTCQIYMTAVYETLITVDPASLTTQIPRLASAWEANADNSVFTFTLAVAKFC